MTSPKPLNVCVNVTTLSFCDRPETNKRLLFRCLLFRVRFPSTGPFVLSGFRVSVSEVGVDPVWNAGSLRFWRFCHDFGFPPRRDCWLLRSFELVLVVKPDVEAVVFEFCVESLVVSEF